MTLLAPQFVSLSLIVTGRGHRESPNLSAMDCLAWAIERDDDPVDLPPLVARTVDMFTRAAASTLGADA